MAYGHMRKSLDIVFGLAAWAWACLPLSQGSLVCMAIGLVGPSGPLPCVEHLRDPHVRFQRQKTLETFAGFGSLPAGLRDVGAVPAFGLEGTLAPSDRAARDDPKPRPKQLTLGNQEDTHGTGGKRHSALL